MSETYRTQKGAFAAMEKRGYVPFPRSWGPAWEGTWVRRDGQQAGVVRLYRAPRDPARERYEVEEFAAGDLTEETVARVFEDLDAEGSR